MTWFDDASVIAVTPAEALRAGYAFNRGSEVRPSIALDISNAKFFPVRTGLDERLAAARECTPASI